MGLRDSVIGYGTAFSLVFILLALFLRDPEEELKLRLKNVVNGLMEVEEQHVSAYPKVAVGYGACVDLYVNAKEFLHYNEIAAEAHHFGDIDNVDQLYQSYAYYFQHGAACESYMSNSTLFDSLVKSAEKTLSFRYALGGNAPVMAIRLYREGCRVLLGSTLTFKQRKFIPEGVTVVGPIVNRDDTHLILEYKTGDRWGPYTSPRSNRFIIHNDVHNPLIRSFDQFQKHVKSFKPDLLVISGLQLMDNYPYGEGVRETKLKGVRDQMTAVGPKTKIHFEMASITEPMLLYQLRELVIPHTDSLGMNEQELANLYNLYYYGNVSLVTDSTPRVATVLDQMRGIYKLIKRWNKFISGSRSLTRIHVHTLAFQAILTDLDSVWKKPDIAAAKASLTAYRHVCASSEVDLERATLLLDDSFSTSISNPERSRVSLVPEHPVSCWNESTFQLCVAPGLVCTEAAQTAGGGDNISAAALAMQL